ncbi:MAG TPA: 6-carboxytetrahydropterin synthase, partial [Chloroflexota bacterium]|nr:6-carboxytetrahydropterin synthase [Chloroflexota bacterium]
VTRPLDHQYLNESVPVFRAGTQPTAEALARYCFHALRQSLRARFPDAGATVSRVAVAEGELLDGWCAAPDQGSQEDYVNGQEHYGLTRAYTFSAAHRLHEPALSDAENQSRFGKCNNPHGHGHDYRLDVTVSGPLDPQTSMVVDLACLDEAVQAKVIARLDHRHLNHEVPPFDQLNPTSENVLRVIWGWLEAACPAPLVEHALYETPRNRFTLRRGETR